MSDGLKAKHRAAIIAALAANDRVERAVLFGSRAVGTNAITSDVDIALFGQQLTLTDQASLAAACEELPMAQSVDLVLHSAIDNPALVEHIRSHGVEWYRRGGASEVNRAGLGEVGARRNWPVVKLEKLASDKPGSIAIGPFGSRMKSDVYTPFGVPVIRGTNISASRAWKNSWVYVSNDFADRLPNCNAHEGDLVFPHRGSIGEVAVVPGDKPRYMISTSLMKFRPDPEKVSSLFLFYYFRSDFGRNEIMRYSSQVGTPGIGQPLTSLRQFQVVLPPREEQEHIAEILSVLDDKIELNRKTNEILEAMARALFKDWFVDFGPVRAKAEGREAYLPEEIWGLFPDSFEDSDLGEIPRGWGVKTLKEATCLLSRGISPKYCEDGGVTVINQKCIRNGIVDFTKSRRHDSSLKNIKDRAIRKFDALINSTGMGTLGRVAMTPELDVSQVIVDSHVTVVRGETKEDSFYLSLLLLGKQDKIEAMGEGSTGQTELSRLILGSMLIVLPTERLIKSFYKCACNFYEKKWLSEKSSTIYAQLRDTLLPKLISGQIHVPDPEQLVEAML